MEILPDKKRIEENLNHLKTISENANADITRIGFTKEYRQGVEYIKKEMEKAGLAIREDSIGNIYGTIPGKKKDLPSIVSGSHLDTVRCAGAYDGIAGMIAALEVARMIKENNIELNHTYEVMGIIEEEGTRFSWAMLGSRFVSGALNKDNTRDVYDNNNQRLEEVINEYLKSQDTCEAYRKDEEILAFLELHIEQGPVLESRKIDIGIVENIVSIAWISVEVNGFSGHSGTVPMSLRQNAGIGAFSLIVKIQEYVMDNFKDALTFTVGKLELLPGSTNSIPAKCSFTMDIRSGEPGNVKAVIDYAKGLVKPIEEENNVQINLHINSMQEPVKMDNCLRELIKESAKELGLSHMSMNSGAGHDAMIFASRWKSAMIFVPCHKGITHNPAETLDMEDLRKGIDVLYNTILKLDKEL